MYVCMYACMYVCMYVWNSEILHTLRKPRLFRFLQDTPTPRTYIHTYIHTYITIKFLSEYTIHILKSCIPYIHTYIHISKDMQRISFLSCLIIANNIAAMN